jgi:hypothetical protein
VRVNGQGVFRQTVFAPFHINLKISDSPALKVAGPPRGRAGFALPV